MANKVKGKSKAAATKRFKKRKGGTISRGHAKTSHLFSNKSTKNKRQAKKQTSVSDHDAPRVSKMLGK